MSRELDLSLLRTFLAVLDTSNMTLASHQRCLTQGAVSQQIRRLEEQFGGALFHRTRTGLHVTALGERLAQQAREMLRLNDDIWQELRRGRCQETLRIGVPPDLFSETLCPLVTAFHHHYPDVLVTLICATSPSLHVQLAQNEIDLALLEEIEGADHGEVILHDQLVWVGAKKSSALKQDVLPVALVDRTCVFRLPMVNALNDASRPWTAIFENGSIEATANTVRADLAVTALLRSTVPNDLEIISQDKLPKLPGYAITLQTAKHETSIAAEQMSEFIKKNLKQLSAVA